MSASSLNFSQVRQKLEQSQRELLVLLPNQAQNYFLSSFKNQGFDGQPWKEVQRREDGTKAYKYPKSKGLQRRTSPILVGAGYKVRGGTLRRAVSNMSRTAQIRTNGFRMIVDLPYAAIHNEGGTINKGASSRTMNFKVNMKTGRTKFSTAKRANFQQDVNIGAHSINMPKRQYIGQTTELTRMQEELITKTIDRIWRQ